MRDAAGGAGGAPARARAGRVLRLTLCSTTCADGSRYMYGESSSTSEESKVGIPSTCRLQYDPPARYAPRAPGRDREAR